MQYSSWRPCFHKNIQIRASQIQIFKMTICPHTQPELFGLYWWSTKMHFNIFPGQHGRQTEIPSNHCGQFWTAGWESDSLLHHLSSNYKMFFMKSGTVFHWRLFRTYMSQFQIRYELYYMQMVAQLHINKEMCTLHNCFHYFVHPLYIQKIEQFQLYIEMNMWKTRTSCWCRLQTFTFKCTQNIFYSLLPL